MKNDVGQEPDTSPPTIAAFVSAGLMLTFPYLTPTRTALPRFRSLTRSQLLKRCASVVPPVTYRWPDSQQNSAPADCPNLQEAWAATWVPKEILSTTTHPGAQVSDTLLLLDIYSPLTKQWKGR